MRHRRTEDASRHDETARRRLRMQPGPGRRRPARRSGASAWRLASIPGVPPRRPTMQANDPNRWTFPAPVGRKTTDPILLAFQRDWGKPAGDDRAIAPGAWKARMTASATSRNSARPRSPCCATASTTPTTRSATSPRRRVGYLGDRLAAGPPRQVDPRGPVGDRADLRRDRPGCHRGRPARVARSRYPSARPALHGPLAAWI